MCHTQKTLHLIAIDEAHLYAQHGSTFCNDLSLLGCIFFDVVFKIGSWHPLFLTMTATMTKPLLRALTILTHVDWTKEKHQLWAKYKYFR